MRPTDGPRHAGAAVGWGALFFAALQLGLAVPMERGRPELRDLEYGTKRARLRDRLAESPGRPLLLVLGSSRTNHGFDPAALPPLPAVRPPRGGPAAPPVVFNAALMGSGPVLELLCLRRLLADGIRPDWVLLECWPPFLYQEGDRADVYKLPAARLGFRDLAVLAPYHPRPASLYEDWCLARAAPWSSSRFTLLTRFARDWLPRELRRDDQWNRIDGCGWLPYAGSADPALVRQRLPRVREQFRPALEQFHVSETSDRALHEVLSFCRREGIGVGLLALPESRTFRGWYPAGAAGRGDEYVRRFAAEWQVPVLDAHDWSPEADFGDAVHLVPAGARAFSARLGLELLPAFLRGDSFPVAASVSLAGFFPEPASGTLAATTVGPVPAAAGPALGPTACARPRGCAASAPPLPRATAPPGSAAR